MVKIQFSLLMAGLLTAGIAAADEFSLTSPQIGRGAMISDAHVFSGFDCAGGNISPVLNWKNAPPGTKSFAVTLYDPDVQTGSGWWHWVIFDIPAGAGGLPENAGNPNGAIAPAGSLQSRTDFGVPGYGGPCPPKGDRPHRYEFTVYALKVDRLPLDADASGAMVGYYLHQNLIEKAVLEAKYGRPLEISDRADEGASDVISALGGGREGGC